MVLRRTFTDSRIDMPVCPSGSQPKPGTATSVVVTPDYIQSLLPPVLAWLYPYLPFMQGLNIGDVSAFCSAEPPSFSTPTAAEFYSFLTSGPLGSAATVTTFLQNITQAYIWYSLCQCIGGSTPTAITPPTQPTGLPVINPTPIVGPAPATACRHADSDIAGLGTAGVHPILPLFDITVSDIAPTSVVFTTQQIQSGFSLSWRGAFYFTTDGSDPASSGTRTIYVPGTISTSIHTVTWPSGAARLRFDYGQDDTHPFTYENIVAVDFYCGGQSPGVAPVPCCPPDATLRGYLAQILDLVTILQRQTAPFAYVAGASHSVSGFGELTISDLIGIKFIITATTPGTIGVEAGDPEEVFGLGWITWGTTDGWTPRQFLGHTDNLSLPPNAGAFTRLGYSLSPGVSATVVELIREP